MQSRRDQLQAYRFLNRRALAALVAGEPDAPEPPMRRLSLTTITGIMVAILVAAGFAAYGLIKPGSSTKLSTGTIYIERETGARFVLIDNTLHPTLNYTSAVLAAITGDQQGKVAVKTVGASTLAHKPHGSTIGIDGIPDSLPRNTNRLVRSPWTVCSQVVPQQTDNNVARVTVSVGDSAQSTALPQAEDGVVVTTPSSLQPYLLWHGERLQITSPVISRTLNLQTGQPLIVGTAFLNALPQGPALTVPSVPSAGTPVRTVPNTPTYVGQLIQITETGSYLLVLPDGVVPVRPIEAALLQTLPLAGERRSPVPVRRNIALGLPASASGAKVLQQFATLPGGGLPHVPDAPAQAGGVCVQFRENAPLVLATPPGTAPVNGTSVDDSAQSKRGLADDVRVPAEKAALVRPDSSSATRFVIAAPGRKFAASTPALGGLGYDAETPVTLPEQLLLLIPTGPALDAATARLPVAGS